MNHNNKKFGFCNKGLHDDEYSNFSGGTSQPYIVRVENKTGSTQQKVKIFGANKNANSPNFGNPAGVNLSSGIPSVGYRQLLDQSANQPFMVGTMYIVSNSQEQTFQPLVITYMDSDGDIEKDVVTPILDPYQSHNASGEPVPSPSPAPPAPAPDGVPLSPPPAAPEPVMLGRYEGGSLTPPAPPDGVGGGAAPVVAAPAAPASTSIAVVNKKFPIGSNTQISISRLLPNAWVEIRFYPIGKMGFKNAIGDEQEYECPEAVIPEPRRPRRRRIQKKTIGGAPMVVYNVRHT